MHGTKERIVEASAELFRRQGYTGTGLKQIVAAANAPFGSLYHFFPEGKEQLGAEVIRASGRMYQQLLEGIVDAAPDVASGVRDCFVGAAALLEETGYADACPIAAVALDVASTNERVREATEEVFRGWIEAGADKLAAAGVPREKARDLSIQMIAALEGSFVLARAMRSTEPVLKAGEVVVDAVRAAIGQARKRDRGGER
ncbi:MAG TPA: TetR/AcrR family transcriptional regulator [Actinomycetota bacterium]|nr:TetR/AcrR family transcriptional regulator [Actinomycetota bacterium]